MRCQIWCLVWLYSKFFLLKFIPVIHLSHKTINLIQKLHTLANGSGEYLFGPIKCDSMEFSKSLKFCISLTGPLQLTGQTTTIFKQFTLNSTALHLIKTRFPPTVQCLLTKASFHESRLAFIARKKKDLGAFLNGSSTPVASMQLIHKTSGVNLRKIMQTSFYWL